jgi:hypothetical protein
MVYEFLSPPLAAGVFSPFKKEPAPASLIRTGGDHEEF